MNLEQARAFLLALSHVIETQQWGDNLVFWCVDKSIGGKMCALAPLDRPAGPVFSFPTSPDRFHELLETEGITPAAYLARAHWVSVERWNILRQSEWHDVLTDAYALTFAKLTPKTRKLAAASSVLNVTPAKR